MGELYSVSFELKFNDKEKAKCALIEYIKENDGKSCNFRLDKCGYDEGSFTGVMKAILPEEQGCVFSESSTEFNGSGSFNASYGWWMVMNDAFAAIAPYCTNDSIADIWTGDDGETTILRVYDGRVKAAVSQESWVCSNCGSLCDAIYTVSEWCHEMLLCDLEEKLLIKAKEHDMDDMDICEECFQKLLEEIGEARR